MRVSGIYLVLGVVLSVSTGFAKSDSDSESSSGNYSTSDGDSDSDSSSLSEGVLVKIRNENRVTRGSHELAKDAYKNAYTHGDVYLMWGNLKDEWADQEDRKLPKTLRMIQNHGFRPIVILEASYEHIHAAVTNPKTVAIFWSSHGSEEGEIFGHDGEAIPKDAFLSGAHPSFKFMVISSCFGQDIEKHYDWPDGLNFHRWTNKTNTPEYFNYLHTKFAEEFAESTGVDLRRD